MNKVVTLLTLLLWQTHEIMAFRTCSPNTKFILNGKLCFCDNKGHWSEANCKSISRRQTCQPGQIIWQSCNQCICQENGYLLCSNSRCSDGDIKTSPLHGLSGLGLRCTPFRSYYINCNMCICPATGQTRDAQCVADTSCNSPTYQIDMSFTRKTSCIPNVMYITQCRQCLCSDNGYFDPEYCEDKCKKPTSSIGFIPSSRCMPRTLFKVGCNLCRCPTNGILDEHLCIKTTCNKHSKSPVFHTLRSDSTLCVPHSFTVPRCLYCLCNADEIVDKNVCLEIDCSKTGEFNKHYTVKDKCSPGEMVPICMECFCLRHGQTMPKYCSKICSYKSKLNIIEMVLKDSDSDVNIIEKSKIKELGRNEHCSPNSLYIDNGKYCLCSENGDSCTSFIDKSSVKNKKDVFRNNIDINSPCEPNTFVEFDCNTCYCFRNGKINPKWCTYDDCEAKRIVIELHKTHNPISVTDLTFGTCRPGVISKFQCNFCICPESGILKNQACTQNNCTEFDHTIHHDKLTCEPLAYYEVDCNICYCPRDGIKNLAKCTKNQCKKSILRSDSCVPGQLFSDDCNLCVCPPDGNKRGKTCTAHICPHIPPWQLFKLSESIVNNRITLGETRTLDICFPGEEFIKGCSLCVCPDLGLKMYATCEPILCDDNDRSSSIPDLTIQHNKTQKLNYDGHYTKSRRAADDDCFTYNVSRSAERKECTPGSIYIIRCKQCICPYLGNINNFCRPLPKNVFCEQAFPYFNYLPMGRRADFPNNKVNKTIEGNRSPKPTKNIQIKIKHEHTKYRCKKPGNILDKCFICNCEGNTVIEEHCFKSDADNCKDAKPSFLVENKIDI